MKLFGTEVMTTSTNSIYNILQVKDFSEIFFDVYEVELDNGKYPLEKISEYKGNPVVGVPLIVEGEERLYPFVLSKGKQKIIFNPNIEMISSREYVENNSVDDIFENDNSEENEEKFIITPEEDEELKMLEESKKEILQQIKSAKAEAEIEIADIKRRKILEANKQIKAKEKALVDMVENARESLLSEFFKISKKIKEEISDENDSRFLEINRIIENKIDDIKNIEKFFTEKLNSIGDSNVDVTDVLKNYLIDSFKESRNRMISEENNVGNNTPIEYAIEPKVKIEKKDYDNLLKDFDKKIHEKFENYKTELRRYVAVYSSGGGTNAVQLADGGTINGNLKVNGNVSSNDLYTNSGVVDGNLLVTGTLSATLLEALSANINVININQYELSGFDFDGDVTVQGSLSASDSIVSNEIYANFSKLGDIQTDIISFNTTTNLPVSAGQLTWDDADGTVRLGLKGSNVSLQLGQEEIIRVVNKTGSNLLENQYKVVRNRTKLEGGAQGQRLAVVLAQANEQENHTNILGVVTENINNNEEGFVTRFGIVRNIDTTGSIQGETWTDGDILYLSENISGNLTNIEPPNHPVKIGYVVYAHQNNGKIFVDFSESIDEIGELHDVKLTNLENGQSLIYDVNDKKWKNKSIGIRDLSDVQIIGDTIPNGSLLAYNTTVNKFNNTTILNGGNF
jgi:hypothetical protein